MLFMILSLGEDRCEGENDKVFTRSALITSDLRGTGEGMKAKKENQLRRAYVRARRADSVKVLVFDRSSCVKWGRGEEKSLVCARLFPCFAQSIRVAGRRCRVGITVCAFPSCSVRCVVGAIVRAPASLRCCGGGSAIHPIHRRATTVIRAKQSMLREVTPSISFISRPGGRLSK